MSENKVEFGFERVHIAFEDKDATELPAWEVPIAIPGAVSFTPSVAGGVTDFYADNTKYWTITSNNGYTADLVMALVPDAIKARMLGWEIDDNGALVEIADGKPERFALLGQVLGDKRDRRFVYFDCQASRPAKERQTQSDTVEVATDTLSLSISPIYLGGKKAVKADLEHSATNSTFFNNFFEQVYLPQFDGGQG